MGLKIGFAAEAARRGLYVPIGESNKKYVGFAFAKVRFQDEGIFLYFLNGAIGHLQMNQQHQLEVMHIQTPQWVPTKEAAMAIQAGGPPSKLVIFEGSHVIQEFTEKSFLPSAIHLTDEERFREPHGPWEKAVAHYLKSEPSLTGS